MIYDAFRSDSVEVWSLNADLNIADDWLTNYRIEKNLHILLMENADEAYDRFRLGLNYRKLPPMYVLIDKHGIVRYRSYGEGLDGREKIEEIAELVGELLKEE